VLDPTGLPRVRPRGEPDCEGCEDGAEPDEPDEPDPKSDAPAHGA
jgi:hypothetical protein